VAKAAIYTCTICGATLPQQLGKGRARKVCPAEACNREYHRRYDLVHVVRKTPGEVTSTCCVCGEQIVSSGRAGRLRTCCDRQACRQEQRRRRQQRFLASRPTVTCTRCGRSFPLVPSWQRRDDGLFFCSRACSDNSQRELRSCLKCGQEFSCVSSSDQQYCSRKCATPMPLLHEVLGVAGYRRLQCGPTLIYEHVLVAEKRLGRALTDSECVHHVNGDKGDNRPGNIMVFASDADHIRFHHSDPDWKAEWYARMSAAHNWGSAYQQETSRA
jgi:hypothetical protein